MAVLERTTTIAATRSRVWEFFSDPGNLAAITPPWLGFRIVSAPDRPLQLGDEVHYTIRVFGIRLPWLTLISSWDPPRSFTDSQARGPYRSWVHTHSFEDLGATVVMRDRIEYDLPFGAVGRVFGGALVARQLRAIFDYRERKIMEVFG